MVEQGMERINGVTKLPSALTLLAACFLALSGCPEGAGRGVAPGSAAVTFQSVTGNGNTGEVTRLSLVFSAAITGLTKDGIALIRRVRDKGKIERRGANLHIAYKRSYPERIAHCRGVEVRLQYKPLHKDGVHLYSAYTVGSTGPTGAVRCSTTKTAYWTAGAFWRPRSKT
jgi:hypothetical protein